jgi:hypothetical protein
LLLLIVLISTGLLLAFIFWISRSNSVFSSRMLHWNVVLLSIAEAFILSLWIGRQSWLVMGKSAQQYNDFVSGAVGFSNTSKTIEYYALLSAIITFVVLFLLILKLYETKESTRETEQGLIKLSFFALVPAAIMVGQSLQIANTDTLLNISTGFISLSLAVIYFLKWLLKKTVIKPEDIFRIGGKMMLAITFLVVSEFGMALFWPKFGILLSKASGGMAAPILGSGVIKYTFGIFSIILLALYALLLYIFRKRLVDLEGKLDLGLALSQLGIPLLFFVFLSPPVIYSDGSVTLIRYRLLLFAIVFSLSLIAYLDLFQRFRNKRDNGIGRLVSPWALVAILIYIQSINIGWPSIALDEYHFGEFYLPWWSFQQFGSLPYVDFQPARGLVNYVPGLLSWLFYDNTFSGQSLIVNHFSALYVFLAFFGLRKVTGDFVAFLSTASLFIFVGQPTGNLIVVVVCMAILLKVTYDGKFIQAFWLWVGFSIFIPLFSIAEGSMFILGTLPWGLWLLFQAYRASTRIVLVSLLIFFLVAGILVFTTSLDRILISAIRYLLEESGVNDAANGIIWQQPSQSYAMVTSGYLWQFIRFSWLLLLIPIVVRLVLSQRTKAVIPDQLFLVALFIICIILIPRAAGRIDAESYSRPGLASIAMVFCALPLIVLPPIKSDLHKAGAVLVIALLFGLLGNQEYSAVNAKNLYRQVVNEPQDIFLAKNGSLSNLGNQPVMDENQWRRQVRIRNVLNKLLAPEETYFDTTNHNADYGFQGRLIPVAVPAIYNASSLSVQNRIIDQLEEKQIPLALLSAENIQHDGGPISIRNYAVYKYLLDNYLPFQDEFGHIWMIRKGEEGRLDGTNYKVGSDEENLALLSSVLWQKDLAGLPAAWGNSLESLQDRMTNPQDILKKGMIESTHSLQKLENGDWQVSGPDPYLVIALPPDAHGDLLLIDTSQKITGGPMQVFWESNQAPKLQDSDNIVFQTNSSKFILPLSSAPSWYLSDHLQKIRIDFPDGFNGTFRLNSLTLFDRILD